MMETNAYLEVTLDLKDPIELNDFACLFAALGEQFDSYIRRENPNLKGEVRFYVREIRKGSIVADIIPQIRDVIDIMDEVVIVISFADMIAAIVKKYAKNERVPNATKKDLENIIDLCRGAAHDRDGQTKIETIEYEEGVFKRKLAVSFDTNGAKNVTAAAEAHKADMDRTEEIDRKRVLMVFERSSIRGVDLGKSSGERVIIETFDQNARPLIYASDMAEQRIKHEIREADGNVFKKGFIVDVNVETKDDRPIAYRITNVHQIIDLPQSDEEAS